MKKLGLSIGDIKAAYKGIKHKAKLAAKKGNYEQSLQLVRHCATIAQQFNWIYADEELEDLLKDISEKIITPSSEPYVPVENRVVLYDDFCVSYVLALQYIEALVEAGKDILYMTVAQQSGKYSTIISTLEKKYPQIKIVVIPNANRVKLAEEIHRVICAFKPEKALFHIFAHSVCIPAMYCLPSKIDIYIINLADQTFWLGAKVVDYVLEFRQFGVSVSQQRRPARTGNKLLPETVAKLAKDVDVILGAKDSSGDRDNLLAYINQTRDIGKDFSVLAGNDGNIFFCLQNGGKGGIAGRANLWPQTVASIYDYFVAGEIEKAEEAQNAIAKLQRVFKFGNPNTIIKKAVNLLGYPVGDCRKPFNYLCDEGIEELKAVLEETKNLG